MNPNNLVCRTCLGIISEGKIAHNIDDENGIIKNVRNIREMIMFCVPEMDIYVSISPVICESCIGTLVSVYNFKIRCLRVENAIRSYIVANNVLEGSCVNLNNVVRQQIVEALKQKNWPPEYIKQYVDEHLCNSKVPVVSPSEPGEAFRSGTQKIGVPRMPGNTGPRPSPLNVYENPPMAGNMFNLTPTSSPCNYPSPSMEIPHRIDSRPPIQPPVALPGQKYIRVSKNLMPLRPELPFSPPPPYSTSAKNLAPLGSSWAGEFQHSFLNSLQLTSAANGGRQEAVLLNPKPKALKAKKGQKIKKSTPILGNLLNAGGQNAVPISSNNLNTGSLTRSLENPTPQESESVLNPYARVSPTSGIIRNMTEQEINSLRKVRKTPASKNTKKGLDSDVISIEDDDYNNGNGPIVERIGNDEIMIMNFDEGVTGDNFEVVNGTKEASTVETNVTTRNTNAVPNFNKTILVKVPMIDQETMKRKLTPEDVIEEIESKRRRLTVKLSNRLPYLHKNKKLVVKLRQDRFFTCMFCKFTALRMKAVKKHYWNHHKVCALCNFKCKQTLSMTYHIHTEHREAAEEVIRQKDEKKSEFHCYLCNFTGLSGADLRDHRFRVHLKCDSTGMYQCPVITCTKELAIAYDMIRHIEVVHDKTRDTQCPLCNTKASSRSYLGKHLETHRWTRISCQFCRHLFKNTLSLETHIKKKHPQTENFTGMVSVDDSTSCNDDFIVTLDNLQSTQTTSNSQAASNSASLNNPRIEDRNLDEYEFAMPSLSEMLCAQTLIEEPQDQQGVCTVVSEKAPPTNKRKSIQKKTKKRPKRPEKEKPVQGDLEDCLIVNQEIETVDVSDEENHSYTSDSHVIEIDDDDDNDDNDCVVVETSAQKDSELDQTPRAGSETDTCSEISEAARQQTPQRPVSEDTTDSCSELTATDILDGKRASKNGSLVEEKEVHENLSSDALEGENLDKETNTISSENENNQSNKEGSSENEKNESIVAENIVAESTPDLEKSKSDYSAANEKTPCGAVSENITKTCSELSATDILAGKEVCDKNNFAKEKETQENTQSTSENVNKEINENYASSEKGKNECAKSTSDLEKDKSDNAPSQTCSELSITEIVTNLQKEIDAIGSKDKNDQHIEDKSSESERERNELTPDSEKSNDNENDKSQKMSNKEISQSSNQSDTSKASETECESKSQNNKELDNVRTDTKDKVDAVSENENVGFEKPTEKVLFETNSENSDLINYQDTENENATKNTLEKSLSSEHNKLEGLNRSRTSSEKDQQFEINTPSEPENTVLRIVNSDSETSEEDQSIADDQVENNKDILDTDIHMEEVTNLKNSQKTLDLEVVECQNSLETDAPQTETINCKASVNVMVTSEADPLSFNEESHNECAEAKVVECQNSLEIDAPQTETINSKASANEMVTSESDPLSFNEESHNECAEANLVKECQNSLEIDAPQTETINSKESANEMVTSESDPLSFNEESHNECAEAKLVECQNSLEIDAPQTETINSEASANEMVTSESDPLNFNEESHNECAEAKLDSVESAQKNRMDVLEVENNIREDSHSTANVSDNSILDHTLKEKELEHEPENDNDDNFVVLDEI